MEILSLWAVSMLVAAAFGWLCGFEQGKRETRRQVVGMLRSGARLRRSIVRNPRLAIKADALDEAADRLEGQA